VGPQVGYYANLTALVEGAVAANGGTRTLLLAHSMGNLVTLAFLRSHTPAWRAQHVAALIGLSGPWGGSVTALKGEPFVVFMKIVTPCACPCAWMCWSCRRQLLRRCWQHMRSAE
jgi:alpha-beta hydrolase superfamily lysophospholipase